MRKSSTSTPASNVDEYLAALSPEFREPLARLREVIRSAAPQAEEVISYQIPTYKFHGALVHWAAFKDHCSFFVVRKSILKTFEKELRKFHTSGTTIHFTPEKPLPATLIKKIIKIRLLDNLQLYQMKKNSTHTQG